MLAACQTSQRAGRMRSFCNCSAILRRLRPSARSSCALTMAVGLSRTVFRLPRLLASPSSGGPTGQSDQSLALKDAVGRRALRFPPLRLAGGDALAVDTMSRDARSMTSRSKARPRPCRPPMSPDVDEHMRQCYLRILAMCNNDIFMSLNLRPAARSFRRRYTYVPDR